MAIVKDKPGNIAIGSLNNDLLANLDSVSRDDAVGASTGTEDHLRYALVTPIIVGGIAAATEVNIEAPFNMKLLHAQLGVQTTGTGGDNTLDIEVDGSSILTAAQVTDLTIGNAETDGTVDTTVLAVDVTKGSKITLVFGLATAAAGVAGTVFAQRTGREGGVGVPV